MCKRLALVSLLMLSGLALALAQGVQAQSRWPERPVRIVVPYAVGGNTDGIARITAQAMQESLGQPFVVENRVGGNGSVAAEFTARAEPDGHTLFMAVQGIFAIVPAMSKVRYDPIADFTPISIIGSNQFALSVGKAVPVNSFKEWLDWARAQPAGKLNYSSGSIGSGSHLTMALLLARAGIKAEHVPYKGGALSLQALVSGQVPMGFNNVSEVIPFGKTGELKLLAVSGVRRAHQVPNVPMVAEAGFPGFDSTTWNGLVGPAKLPRAIVDRIHNEIRRRVTEPAFMQRMDGLGVDVVGNTPEEFAAIIRSDIPRWAEAVRLSGAKVE